MVTSVISALAPAAISAGVNFLGSKLGGSGDSNPAAALQNFQPPGFQGGGFGTSFGPGGLTITPTAERLAAVGGVKDVFGNLASELGGQRGKVAPGMSELRSQRLAESEGARRSAVGNLRENLQRRRVLGSSFGQDALTRAEAEFGGLRDRASAESFLQEFELTNQLINQQFGALRSAAQTGLDELNLEAELGAKLASGATNALASNAQTLAKLNAEEAAGKGKFFGNLIQPFAKAAGDFGGKALSSAFAA